MQFASFLALFLAIVSASTVADEDKGCGPCQRRVSSSSSSSSTTTSSHHGGCCRRVCPSKRAIKAVKAQQTLLEGILKAGNLTAFDNISTADFSYSLNVRACTGPSCCYTTGNDEQFMAQYQPTDLLTFYYNTADYIDHYPNGTYVVSKIQVKVPMPAGRSLAYMMNFHWAPVLNTCKYKLSYVDGYSVNCPSYQFDMPACGLCA
jgi:hypothetical protein